MNPKHKMFVHMVVASLVRRRSRMLIALLAIIVGATILSGLVLIYYDVPQQMSGQFRSYGANVILTPEGEDNNGISEDSVKAAAGLISADDLEGYTPFRYENTSVHNLPVTAAGIDFTSVPRTSPYWAVDGELPSGDGEVLVGAKVAETFGLRVGDEMDALNSFVLTEDDPRDLIPSYEIYTDPETGEEYCDHILTLKVTGILTTGGNEEVYIYMTLADIAYLTLEERGYDVVEVSIATTSDKVSSYVERINAQAQGMSAKLVKRVTASEGTVLTKLQSLVFIVTAVVLILTMICVATTMAAVIAERKKEIGLRKALGAYNSSIITEFMSEGLLLGAVGGIFGSVLGYLFADAVCINVFGSAITFRWALVPVTILVSVLVTGIACLIPIRNTIDVDPALVLKSE